VNFLDRLVDNGNRVTFSEGGVADVRKGKGRKSIIVVLLVALRSFSVALTNEPLKVGKLVEAFSKVSLVLEKCTVPFSNVLLDRCAVLFSKVELSEVRLKCRDEFAEVKLVG